MPALLPDRACRLGEAVTLPGHVLVHLDLVLVAMGETTGRTLDRWVGVSWALRVGTGVDSWWVVLARRGHDRSRVGSGFAARRRFATRHGFVWCGRVDRHTRSIPTPRPSSRGRQRSAVCASSNKNCTSFYVVHRFIHGL